MKKLAIMLTALTFTMLGLAGCGDETCDMCPTNPDGQSICSVWNGTYFGSMTSTNGDCGSGESNLLDGDLLVEVSGIGPSATDETQTAITVKLTDSSGNWTVFSGHICNTLDETSPKSFSFKVTYSQTADDQSYMVDNTIDGRFIEADEDQPSRIEGTYNVNFTDLNDAKNSCQLMASISAHL